MKITLVLSVLTLAVGQNSALFSDKENALLPQLFHLDDYDRCLALEDGLFCLGEFELSPVGTSGTYEKIKKYSNDLAAFNRSRLYRGYCVSERCPLRTTNNTTENNTAQRFEQCVQQRARRHALTARLHTLKYCTTHQQHMQKMIQPPDAAQQLFVKVVYAILMLNIIGTVYDLLTGDEQKNGLISSWSLRCSWCRLTAVYDNGDHRLKQLYPIQGMRVIAMLLMILCHSWVQQYQFYVSNPQNFERQYRQFDGIVLSNGTSVTQFFVMISSFMTAYNLLIYSEKHQLSFLMMPVLVVKRIIRIAPVHLLLVGFAATYWSSMRSGANSAIIEEYATSCRRKFWTHALFLNNIVDKEEICLMPTWFLPVDMHLFIVSSELTIIMSRWRHLALPFFAALFVLSSAFCGVVAYVTGWKTATFIVVPENVRGLFRNTSSFSGFYTSSWGSLPACFVGLFLAHLHYNLQEKKYDWSQNQWFKRLRYWFLPSQVALTYLMGVTLREYNQRWVTALCVAVERPLFCCFLLGLTISIINYRGGLMRLVLRWSVWRVPARLSLAMMLCHWIFGVAIAARPLAYHTSTFDVSINFVATIVFGYAASLPITLLVEIPVQRFFAQLF